MIRVPATPGASRRRQSSLQGHLDMVCERDPSSPNDPAEGRIALVRDGEWLTRRRDDARRGRRRRDRGDDGAGRGRVAAPRAARAADDRRRGGRARGRERARPGARDRVDPHQPRQRGGRRAHGRAAPGSTDTWIRIEAPREASVRRCRHPRRSQPAEDWAATPGSGIALGRSNAIKVLGRALREAHATAPFRLVSLDGGKSRNAIPRDADAVISVTSATRGGVPRGARGRRRHDPRRLRQDRRRASRSPCRLPSRCRAPWTDEATTRLLDAIALVPTGPLAMSPDFDGLVETSTSLGEAITEGDRLTLHSLSRSSNDAALPEVIATLDAAARLAGGDARGEAQLQRLAARPGLARAGCGAVASTSACSASPRW